MVVEAAPAAPLIITKAKFLLELLIIALDAPPQFCDVDQVVEGDILGQGGKPILGRFSFAFRPISSHSSARGSVSLVSRCAGRTLCRAKRDESQSALPSRHVI